jgi:hypothetical protein
MVAAFEGSKAEPATMLPVINSFKAGYRLTDVTVVADEGMISEANQQAIAASGCRSSSAPGSPTCLTRSDCGAMSTPVKTFPMGTCSPSPGRLPPWRRPAQSPTGSSITGTP